MSTSQSPILFIFLLLGTGIARLDAAGATSQPNVLFIAVDDLRPELGCYGSEVVHSPNIDRLANSGLIFNHAYCQQAVCLPSRASLLTGARPDSTKAWDLSTDFRRALPTIVTLPQLFKEHGYVSRAMGKIYHHGYDDDASWSMPTVFPKASHSVGNRHLHEDWPTIPLSKKGRGPAAEAIDGPDNCLHDGQLAEMAEAALAELNGQEKPFFLAVGFIRPHLPFNAPTKYWDLYDRDKIPLASNPFRPRGAPEFAFPGGNETRSYAGTPSEQHYPDDHARFLRHGYYAAISYVDAQIGRLLDQLDQLGLRDNTIVVLWGDHGWKLGEHDAWAKHTNVENDTRCPLVISAPNMKNAGQKCDALVELVDVFPTLAELAGLPLPNHLEGTSMVPLMNAPDRPWKSAAFSQYPRQMGKLNLMGYSMRTKRYRFTKWVHRGNPAKVEAVELYDHENDSQENTNVADDPQYSSVLAKLDAQWKAGWRGAASQVLTATTTANTDDQAATNSNKSLTRPEPLSLDFWKMEFQRETPRPPTLANVAYGSDPLQKLDFWQAESEQPTPLVFFIHGGAWRANDKDRVSGLPQYLAAGISVVSINYRFLPSAQAAGVKQPVKWPLEDAARALQFVRSKATQWNIDKTRIGASGGSAGACSSLWLAFHDDMADPDSDDPISRESTRVACTGTVGAQTTLDPFEMREWIPNMEYGGQAFGFHGNKQLKISAFQDFYNHRDEVLESIHEYSPYHWVSQDDPPAHLFYSSPPAVGQKQKNFTHSANFGVKLKEKMQSVGVECHVVYPGTNDTAYPDPVAFMIEQLTHGANEEKP